jgi:hypothetical protein
MQFRAGVILVALSLLLAACGKTEAPPVPAAQSAARPDLAAECSKTAAAWFKGAYGEGNKTLSDGRTTRASQQAYYNAERKQCVARLTADTSAQDNRAAITAVSVYAMGDKSEVLASVVRVGDRLAYCVVEDKTCQTAQEWESLAAPLMKE